MKETLRAIAAKYKEDIVRTAAELIRIYEAGKTEPAEGQQADMEETAGTEEQTDERQL